MCGIAAILNVHPRGAARAAPGSIPDAWLRTLDDSIAYRGPHGAGVFRDCVETSDGAIAEVALVHRRLSILDHAGGGQPMVARTLDERGREHRLAVVFNGCIYNHRELRSHLLAQGHAFTSDHSDTEVILRGWQAWGARVFEHLVGMIACVVWESSTPRLVAFRSSPGEKPLYATRHVGASGVTTLAFASSAAGLDTLRAHAGLELAPPPVRDIATWIAFGHARLATPHGAAIAQLAPGAHAWPDANAQPPAPPARPTPQLATGPALVDALDAAIRDAVLARLDADVPLGCLLSGGVDSSLIAAHAARAHPKLTTICVRMPDEAYDESPHAAEVARAIGSSHHTIDVAPKPAEDLVWLIDKLGLPFGDSSLLPTFWACKAAREHVGVALSGDGGDELFFGYERYKAAPLLRRWAWLLGLVPAGAITSSNPKSRTDKLRRLVLAAREGSSASIAAIFPQSMLANLVGDEAARALAWGGLLDTDAMRLNDLADTLESDMLRKVDHASLAAGLEVRSPFLDQRLVGAVQSLGAQTLMPRGELKGLLKHIAKHHVPAAVIDRPKMGFTIPLGTWFRTNFGGLGDLLTQTLGSQDPFPHEILGLEIRRSAVHRLVDEHMDARQDHAQRLYMLLVLALWCTQTAKRRRLVRGA